jgi:sulfur-carrier protein
MIRVLYFARLREQVGTPGEEVDPAGIATVGDLAARLAGRGGPWSEALDGRVKVAVNQEMARPDTPVRDGDEIAFFPPVTGG